MLKSMASSAVRRRAWRHFSKKIHDNPAMAAALTLSTRWTASSTTTSTRRIYKANDEQLTAVDYYAHSFAGQPEQPPPPPLFVPSWIPTGTTLKDNLMAWWKSNNNKKIPKGLEDFFPKGAKVPAPPEAGDTEQQQQQQAGGSTSAGSQKEQYKSTGGSKPPGGDDNQNPEFGNTEGVLALLILIMALRSAMEEQSHADMGQEITFAEFRSALLATGQVQKLVVVNKSVAKVVLRPDAMIPASLQAGGGNNTTTTASSTGDMSMTMMMMHDDDQSTFDATPPSTTGTAATTSRGGGSHKQKSYFFHIGSVETLEEKLAKAQHDTHPEDWVEVQYTSHTNWALELLKTLPMIAFVAAVYFGTRGASGIPGVGGGRGGSSGGGGNIFSIGKSPAKKISKQDIKVTFADVAGAQQAKQEIMEFVEFLKDSSRFSRLGAKIPKGALLCGPPGTGKTLLAKAVAGESGVPFYSISGSDFIEMFVGVGPSRVRDLFKEARQNAPCIVFIDEIDAVGRQRGRGGFSGGGNDERENTLNQLLVEMDGFSPSTGVVVLAGTNRVDILDSALTRPGRFDRQITVDRPDLIGRKEIFEVHLKGIKLESSIEDIAGRLAGLTPGFAGADIANLCNEAAIVAARRKAESVSVEDFEKATDRIIGGLESHKIMSPHEKSVVAHHEAGHAVAGWFLEHADPLLKVTIIPRTSGALGFAQYLPKEVFLRNREQIMDIVCMALAGRAAEQVFFGEVTTGASDDLRRVTQLVYGTIKDYGMTSLGQLSFPSNDDAGPGDKPYSESTAEAMDDEARAIVEEAYQRTVQLITEHKDDVAAVANLLLDRETITHDDMVDLIGHRPFVADPVYAEYVSQKSRRRPEKKEEQEAETPEDAKIPPMEDLTPGLA
mmetsp:Transcript_4456/g.9268  ORF Transcript_4456/g.9268 Transcript_4456/m.9268 type:complete len:890 (-) Transcript_4456:291-2960(-)